MPVARVSSSVLTLGLVMLMVITLSPAAYSEGLDMGLDNGLKYRSADGNFALAVGGRWHLDGADFRRDQTPLQDDWITRRLRLSMTVDLWKDWRLGAQYDFLDRRRPFELLWLRYRGFETFTVTAGQFSEPFSLEQMTHSNAITFLERALPNALVPGTHVGIAVGARRSRWRAAFGGFLETRLQDEDTISTRDGGGLTGRWTATPIARRGKILHIGASGSLRRPDERGRMRLRSRPESEVTDVRLVDTGRIRQVDYLASAGLESAWMSGPWSVQGEYIGTTVYRENNLAPETFHGGYLYASVFLTGEQRAYSVRRGSFSAIKPKRASGAWELALRHSYLDLNGRTVFGGREDNLTWGINWYANRNVRLMFNYTQVDTDAHAGDPDILSMRLQMAI